MNDLEQKNAINHFKMALSVQKERMNEALRQLNEGKTPLLGGFEEEVISLCEQVEKSPPVVAHALKYDMKEMIGAAEELVQALEIHRANLQSKIDNHGKH